MSELKRPREKELEAENKALREGMQDILCKLRKLRPQLPCIKPQEKATREFASSLIGDVVTIMSTFDSDS